MIIDVSELLEMPEFIGIAERTLNRKLKAVESLIRSYTNNNFQNRMVRFEAPSSTSSLFGFSEYLKVGDTVQISESINNGLYTVKEINQVQETVQLEDGLFETDYNLITKVEYPDAIVEGVINLMIWEVQNRSKVGIKSETLSRHSVTYYDQDANNQLMGYPVTLLGFLKPYIKARF
jgi:hypothetical protein